MNKSKISHKNELGRGIYTASDISHILGFPVSKVSRYLNNYWDNKSGKELFKETYSWSVDNKIKAVNFYVLIELYTFISLQDLGISNQKIFKTRAQIAKDTNSQYPFATAGILCDGKTIWYEFEKSIVNSDGSKQTNLKNIITEFSKRIDFNQKDNIAERFYPSGKTKSVVVDPNHQFGLPVIKGTNINTDVIFSMYNSGEKIKNLSILYDVTTKEIKDTIEFCKKTAA
jgi:uncharacterized protein (DUF433 family)